MYLHFVSIDQYQSNWDKIYLKKQKKKKNLLQRDIGTCLLCIGNILTADDLVMQGPRASADILLT